MVVRGRAYFLFHFQFIFASRVMVVHSAKESWRRDSIPHPPTKQLPAYPQDHGALTVSSQV